MNSIVIVSAIYPPEPVVSAVMGQDLADYLTQKGIKVTVLCPQPSRPIGTDFSHYRNNRAPIVLNEGDITVVRLPSFNSPQSRVLPRAIESYSFGRHVCRTLRHQKTKPKVIYVNSWPILSQILIAMYIRRNRISMVLQIMDIYPESLLNKIRLPERLKKMLGFLLTQIDRWVTKQADSVIVISENMKQIYVEGRGIQKTKISTINFWHDEGLFDPLPSRSDSCERYNISAEKFTFLYFGNIGAVAGVEFLIHAFHKVNIGNAQLLIIGDGAAKAGCVELVDHLGTNNVHFISDPDVKNVPLLQSIGHVCLLPMKRGDGKFSIPSKLPAYMFSAKPVLSSVDSGSDTARLIRQAKCGWVGPSEEISWMVAQMKAVVSLPEKDLQRIGENGRQYGLKHFSKSIGVQRLADVLLKQCWKDKLNN